MLASFLHEGMVEAGCDEAGRGCLAGPVFAAAVILPADFRNELLNDSKQLTGRNRYILREVIQKEALSWAVGSYDNKEIDEVNILNASIFSMHRALHQLKVKPDYILVDGNRFKPYQDIPYTCVVKGDGKFLSIAAASILAKTYRDDFMLALHKEYPFYKWGQNKGYPTKAHREAIKQHGITPYHRKSFRLIDNQLSLKF
ncbi:ribonuclease HII [Prolixibacter sp. SD074]|jgi:ribonuclease HII|uniref:ribonuclease HII n=1 Tax=Prolixibacter sp. SD074 TaxID=2652391 RepID=UPI00126EF0CC|nr:ribonuclease HII [Prolixibacter sp. SD074]GET30269.1 ribonuclease HII [Prolixibacter sp. SD074]